MTKRYPGGYITKTPPTVSTTSAPGIWTMEQQAAYQKAGTWPFGGPFTYIEDVFSTWLYTGTGSAQTITNGIDLSTYGGLVWSKDRSQVDNNRLYDTVRGTNNVLISNSTSAALTDSNTVTAFNSNGYSIGSSGNINFNGDNFASWTFRKQPKFFDVVTYTGTGSARTVAHNLGSVPGCMIIKRTDDADDWIVYHRSVSNANRVRLALNLTSGASSTSAVWWNNTTPTSTVFTVGTDTGVNASGGTYVAYLFAHNAGGFGLTGTDNVISCGSFTQASGGTTVNLGFEPQWVMVKNASSTGNWFIFDNMRGNTVTLYPNLSNAEGDQGAGSFQYNATGFTMADYITGSVGSTLIYIAIRRGPMKTPTDATKVFGPAVWTGTGTNPRTFTDSSWGFVGDYLHNKSRSSASYYNIDSTRLTGSGTLSSNDTGAELNSSTSVAGYPSSWNQTGFTAAAGSGSNNNFNASGETYVGYMWGRAPGFFDVVCYTGTGSNTTVAHNLGVAPELMIVKSRSAGGENWNVYSATLTATKYLSLNLTNAEATDSLRWNDTAPTASVFSLGTRATVNGSGTTFVAYLFASCPGVSKVGSYTGTGTTKQIDCGFTGGARFVLIKRTDSTGDWYYWDSARGIVAGNDPYLLMNTSAAEVTNTDYVDTYAAGFEISSTAPAAINANGGSFIFLAVA